MTISIYVVVAFCIVFGFSILANIIFVYFMYLHITGKLDVVKWYPIGGQSANALIERERSEKK